MWGPQAWATFVACVHCSTLLTGIFLKNLMTLSEGSSREIQLMAEHTGVDRQLSCRISAKARALRPTVARGYGLMSRRRGSWNRQGCSVGRDYFSWYQSVSENVVWFRDMMTGLRPASPTRRAPTSCPETFQCSVSRISPTS